MDVKTGLFYLFAVVLLFAAFRVITARNPVYAALYLVLAFFQASALWLLLKAEFLAITLVLVYVGAVMVLFLFVLMLMNLNKETEPQKNKYMLWSGAVAGGCLMFVIIAAVQTDGASEQLKNISGSSIGLIRNLGITLYKDYVVPFEISSILFLSAMVGAVVIGKKEVKSK